MSVVSTIARKVVSLSAVSKPHQYLACATLSSDASNKAVGMIINAVGPDRVGIVSDMTKVVTDAGGNIGQSQATKLGSYFSLMMVVKVPPDSVGEVRKALHSCEGMNASIFETEDPKEEVTPTVAYSGEFTLEGADNPGIVHKLTTALTNNGLNIDKIETSQDIAPQGGTMLFKMKGIASALEPLSHGFNVEKIRAEIEELGDSINCDITLEDI